MAEMDPGLQQLFHADFSHRILFLRLLVICPKYQYC